MQSIVMHFLSHLRYVGDFHRKCLYEILHMFTAGNRPLHEISVLITYVQTRPHSAVGNVSDCRSKSHELDPIPVP